MPESRAIAVTTGRVFVCDVVQVAQSTLSSSSFTINITIIIIIVSSATAGGNGIPDSATTIMDGDVYARYTGTLRVRNCNTPFALSVHRNWWSHLRHIVDQQGDCHAL